MKSGRPRFLLLHALIAILACATAYVWIVGPIVVTPRFRPIHWETPARPLRLLGALLLLRVLAPWIAGAWRWIRPRAGALLARPGVWMAILILGVSGWFYWRHHSKTLALEVVREARDAGYAQIGLATRPVLNDLELVDGLTLPDGAGGRKLEIACGLGPEADSFLTIPDGGLEGRVIVGSGDPPAAGSQRRTIGVCRPQPGRWTTATLQLPADLTPGDRLFFEAGDSARALENRFAWWSAPGLLPEPDRTRPNLVIISIDTLRADHLGAYGYRRPVSPNIDRLALRGTVFEKAISQSPWTTPSHMTLFTSLFPSVHAVDAPTTNRQRRLADDKRLLAEILRDADYATAAFTGSGAISALYGFWRGFSVYDETDHDDPKRHNEDISGVYEGASRWLVEHHRLPFFLFFHTYEVHAPYVHRTFESEAAGEDDDARVTALYDGDILYADGFIGQLISLIEGLGISEQTIIVLLSDHGEELEARYPGKRIGHGHTVYDELLHVPLIVVAPGRVPPGGRIPQMVQVLDVMPTLLEMMNLPAPEGIQGVSFAKVFAGEPLIERHAFAEATNNGPERKTLRGGRYKYIKRFERTDRTALEIPADIPEEEFFDLFSDPREKASILDRGGAVLADLRRQLEAIVALNLTLRSAAPEQELDAETIRRLKALGYIQ